MTQEEFNTMLQTAIAQGLPGGYYTSEYSGEEVDELLGKAKSAAPLESPAFTGTPTVNGEPIGTGGGTAAPASGANLLDNWYFPASSVIDQRGGYVVPPGTAYYSDTGLSAQAGTLSAYTTANPGNGTYGTITVSGTTYYVDWTKAVRGYTPGNAMIYHVDRWVASSSISAVVLSESGLNVVNGPTYTGDNIFVQRLDLGMMLNMAGQTLTLSAMIDGELLSGQLVIPDAVGAIGIDVSDDVAFDLNRQPGFVAFRIQLKTPDKVYNLKAAKLELGDTQTLACQDENGNWVLNDLFNKYVELAKCKRYYFKFTPTGMPAFIMGGGTVAEICVQFPVMMHTAPTASLENTSLAVFSNNQKHTTDNANIETKVGNSEYAVLWIGGFSGLSDGAMGYIDAATPIIFDARI